MKIKRFIAAALDYKPKPVFQVTSSTLAPIVREKKEEYQDVGEKKLLARNLFKQHRQIIERYEGAYPYAHLAKEQKPWGLWLQCGDSRMQPLINLNLTPGKLLKDVAAGNIVQKFHEGIVDSAWAIIHLGLQRNVSHIFLVGHTGCGAIQALMEDSGEKNPLNNWVQLAKGSKEKVLKRFPHASLEVKLRACEDQNILDSAKNLLTHPEIKKRVEEKTLFIHAVRENLETGMLDVWDGKNEKFVPAQGLPIIESRVAATHQNGWKL